MDKSRFFTTDYFSPRLFFGLCAITVFCLALPRALPIIPVLFGIACIPYLKTRINSFKPDFFFLSVIGFFAYAGMACLWSPDPAYSFSKWAKSVGLIFLGLTLIWASAKSRLTAEHLKKASLLLIPVMLCCALFFLIEYYFHYPVLTYFLKGDNGEIPNGIKNLFLLNRSCVFVVLLSLPVSLIVWRSSLTKQTKYVFLCLLYALLFVLTLVSESQTSFIALLLIGVGILYPSWKPVFQKMLITGIAVFICAAPLIPPVLYKAALDNNLAQDEQGWLYKASSIQRLEVWNFMSDKISDAPLFGHGVETARFFYSDAVMPYMKTNHVMHPHNFALQIWLEFGMAGVVLFLLMLYALCQKIIRNDDGIRRYYFAVLISTLGVLSVGYSLWQAWQIGMIMSIVAMSVMATKSSLKSQS
jgi:O-antigen ligase